MNRRTNCRVGAIFGVGFNDAAFAVDGLLHGPRNSGRRKKVSAREM